MIKEEKIEKLLAEISELENLVKTARDEEDLSIRTLSECGNITFGILEQIKQLEAEKIRMMSARMAEQQEELMRLNALFEKYQTSAEMYKEHIAATVCKTEAVEAEPETDTEKEDTKAEETVQSETIHNTDNAIETEAIEEKENTTECVTAEIGVNEEPDTHEEETAEEIKTEESQEAAPVILTVAEERNQTLSLNDIIEKRQLADFRKAFSLNDRFRFRRELFGNSDEKMNEAIDCLNEKQSYEESVNYIVSVLKWNMEDATVADFVKLLERRFV